MAGVRIALRLEILIARVAVALGHFVLRVAHDGGAVDVGRDLPAERLVEQVVLRRGGKVLAAADHMGDAHEMIVDDVGEVVGRQTVALQKHLVVKRLVLHRDVAEDGVAEGGGALLGDALADDVGLAGGDAGLLLSQAAGRGRDRPRGRTRRNPRRSPSFHRSSNRRRRARRAARRICRRVSRRSDWM